MTAAFVERTLRFACEGAALLGVLAEPAGPRLPLAVVIVVGGPQYRAGSHRQFVHLARHLAAGGVATLRFDVRGMGDSDGEPLGFERQEADIGAAVDALAAQVPAGTRIALWGLCDGASAALLYLHARPDARVAGVCLLNPWVRSQATEARTRVKHYYLDRLRSGAFWRKLLSGGVAASALAELLGNVRRASGEPKLAAASYQTRMAQALEAFKGSTLLVLSGDDYTAKEFLELAAADGRWQALLRRRGLERFDVDGADHTFSRPGDKARVADATLGWLRRLAAA